MTNWLEQAFGVGDETEPAPQPAKPIVKSFWCVVAQPSGAPGDVGETIAVHYIVEGDRLTLCDQDGKTGDKSRTLKPGDDPRQVASRLARAAHYAEQPRSEFNRPLHYRPLGLA